MKSSGNSSIGMLIFLALATIVFIFMILRPPVEKTAMNLGVPMNSETAPAVVAPDESTSTEVQTDETESKVEESTTSESEDSATTEEAPKEDSESETESEKQTSTEDSTETSVEETTTESTTTN